MNRLRGFVALAGLLDCGRPSITEAGGFYAGDLGARGMGRAGAFVAAPDSVLALHYNPAGLSLLRGLHLEASLALVEGRFEFDRTCPCTFPERLEGLEDAAGLDAVLEAGFAERPVRNEAGFRGIPFLGAAYGFDRLDLALGFAAYGPHGAAYRYGARDYETALLQPQRYSLIEATSVEANYQLGVALSPIAGLRLGGTILLYQAKSEQYLHIYANTQLTRFAENVSTVPRLARSGLVFDIPVQVEFDRGAALDWSLGASYEIFAGFSVGASVRGKRSIRADGRLSAQLPEVLTQSGITMVNGGGPIQVELELPAIARFGVAYQLPGWFGAEVAAVYEGWSVHDRVKIRAQQIELEVNGARSSLGTLYLERNWQDTVSIRAAVEVELLDPWFGGSLGYFYEPAAVPEQRLQVAGFDLDKHGLAIGLHTEWYGVRLDVAAQQVFLESLVVKDTLVEMPGVLDPVSPENPDALGATQFLTRISNGKFGGSYTMFTASLSASFDELL